MKRESQNKIVFRHLWGWKGESGNQLQSSPPASLFLPAKLLQFAQSNLEAVLEMLNTSSEGLSDLQSDLRRKKIGLNEIAHEKPPRWYVQFLKTFQNPLVILIDHSGHHRSID
jgi:Mg2+-importing ATPase